MEELKETGRIEAFSDGVFAVAITLLVLNLQVPKPPPSNGLLGWLGLQWPAYLAFVTSFAIVGVMWINHHRMFTLITRSDSVLMALNLLLLMLIVFIPFPTALVAQYISLSQQSFAADQRAAALVYNGTAILLAICFNVLWRYATYKGRLQGKNSDIHATQTITKQYRFGPLFYAVAFGLAWVYVPASLILNLLMAVYFALPLRKSPPLPQGE
jgi:uncharacterized membrane protein